MKTIVFYSYKGGIGKSLAAANLAVFLSRIGKNCALLDLDFDGPSLHYKFSSARQSIPGDPPRGFLRYLLSQVREASDHNSYPLTFKTPQEMNTFLDTWLKTKSAGETFLFEKAQPLEDLQVVRKLDPNPARGLKGTIHLIPAGDILTANYWPWALGLPIRRVLGFEYDKTAGGATDQFYNNCRIFFNEIKQRFGDLSPTPDYFIVDVKSGAHQMATSIIANWADVLVCIFGNNNDTLEYLEGFLPRIYQNICVLPVLSRVPLGVHYLGNPILQRLLRKIDVNESDLPIVYSYPEMEIEEHLVMGFDEPLKNCQLTKDYLELFAKILSRATGQKNEVAILTKEIGLERLEREDVKRFKLKPDEGLMINLSDNSRNVSFKHETFQLLLKGLEKGLEEGLSPGMFAPALQRSGEECGKRFGTALTTRWGGIERLKAEEYGGIQADIQEWCKFDSDVGFGKFKLDLSDQSYVVKGRSLESCKIVVLNSFLVPVDDAEPDGEKVHHKFCHFMEGYIFGVFTALFGADYSVVHTVDPNTRNCVFSISKQAPVKQLELQR